MLRSFKFPPIALWLRPGTRILYYIQYIRLGLTDCAYNKRPCASLRTSLLYWAYTLYQSLPPCELVLRQSPSPRLSSPIISIALAIAWMASRKSCSLSLNPRWPAHCSLSTPCPMAWHSTPYSTRTRYTSMYYYSITLFLYLLHIVLSHQEPYKLQPSRNPCGQAETQKEKCY